MPASPNPNTGGTQSRVHTASKCSPQQLPANTVTCTGLYYQHGVPLDQHQLSLPITPAAKTTACASLRRHGVPVHCPATTVPYDWCTRMRCLQGLLHRGQLLRPPWPSRRSAHCSHSTRWLQGISNTLRRRSEHTTHSLGPLAPAASDDPAAPATAVPPAGADVGL